MAAAGKPERGGRWNCTEFAVDRRLAWGRRRESTSRVGSLLDEARYRRFLAETHPELAIDDARLGGVPSFLAPLDIREPLAPGRLRRIAGAIGRGFPGLVTPPALFLGTPFERYDQTHLLHELGNPASLTDRARAAARDDRREVVVLTNVRPERVDPIWRDLGWTVLPSFPDAVVPLSALDFEAHLATLPAGDRSGMRRNIRKFERAGHRLERIADGSGLGDALYRCYRPLYERATVRWQAHTTAYLEGLTGLGDAVDLVGAFSGDGQLIGFVVAFEDGPGLQAGRIGVHPDFHRRDAIYFRLMYHVLEHALQTRGGSGGGLSFEPTGYRMKRHLGAEKVPLVNLVLGVSPRWRFLLGQLSWLGRRLLAHLEDRVLLERWY